MTYDISPETKRRINKTGFEINDFFRVAEMSLEKSSPGNSAQVSPAQAMEDEKFFCSVHKFLLKGCDETTETLKKLRITDATDYLEHLAKDGLMELSLRNYGECQAEKVKHLVASQINKFGVASPAFVYDELGWASSWRWLLINKSIGLRYTLEVVDNDPDFEDLKDYSGLLQCYIDAVTLVMEVHHNNANYRSGDFRSLVSDIILKDTSSVYKVYRDLLSRVEEAYKEACKDLEPKELKELKRKHRSKPNR